MLSFLAISDLFLLTECIVLIFVLYPICVACEDVRRIVPQMSSSRRGSLPMALSPVPNLGAGGSGVAVGNSAVSAANATARIKSNLSPEYMEAMHIMNESNMAEACELLLSERDYEDDANFSGNSSSNSETPNGNGEKSDQTKLLEFFGRCQHAMKAIEKQVANTPLSPLMPSAPSLAPSRGAGSQSHRGSLPKLKQKPGVATSSKQGVIPMRRTTPHMMNRTAAGGQTNMKRGIERETSLSSLGGGSIGGGGGGGGGDDAASYSSVGSGDNANKKARLSPPTAGKEVKAPPPSALNFLAKLNKDGSSLGGKDRRGTKGQPKPTRRGSAT